MVFYTDSALCKNAGSPNKYYYIKVGENGINKEGFKNIYSAALTAGASKQKVLFNFDDSTEFCYINRLAVEF